MIYFPKNIPGIEPIPKTNPNEPIPQTNPIKPVVPEIIPEKKVEPIPIVPEIKPIIKPEIEKK